MIEEQCEEDGKTNTQNQNLAFAGLLFLLAVVALPFGSDRPFFWYLNGSAVALLGMLCFANNKRGEALLDLQPPFLMAAGGFILIAVLWLILQILPPPTLLPPHPIWKQAADLLQVAIAPRVSVDPAATVAMAVRYLTYIFAFLLAAQLSIASHRRQGLLVFIFLVTCSQAVIGIVSLAWGDHILFMEKWAYQGSATGTFVNRNSFATFLAFGLAVGAALMLNSLAEMSRSGHRKRTFRLFRWSPAMLVCLYGFGQIVLGVALLLSGSRMGTVGAVLGLVIVIAMSLTRPDARIYSLALFMVLVATGAALFFFAGAELIRRFGWLDYSIEIRLLLFRQVLTMIGERPLTGYGGGTFETAFPTIHQLPLNTDVAWDSAHNTYLELLVDLGILGIAPVLAVATLAFGIFRAACTSPMGTAMISAIAVIGIGAAHSTVDFPLQIEANVILFLAIVGCGSAESLTARPPKANNITGGLISVQHHINDASAVRRATWLRIALFVLLGGLLSVSLLGAWREAAPHQTKFAGLEERIESILRPQVYITFPWESITARRARLATCIETLNDLGRASDQGLLKLAELNRACFRLARELIGIAPMSANEWLVAGFLAANLGDTSAALAFLQMSYATGPNEQWIARRRVPLAYYLSSHLSLDLMDSFGHDLRLLLIPTFVGEQAKDCDYDPKLCSLLETFAKTPPGSRREFLRAITSGNRRDATH